jgi:hypothetical protein
MDGMAIDIGGLAICTLPLMVMCIMSPGSAMESAGIATRTDMHAMARRFERMLIKVPMCGLQRGTRYPRQATTGYCRTLARVESVSGGNPP